MLSSASWGRSLRAWYSMPLVLQVLRALTFTVFSLPHSARWRSCGSCASCAKGSTSSGRPTLAGAVAVVLTFQARFARFRRGRHHRSLAFLQALLPAVAFSGVSLELLCALFY